MAINCECIINKFLCFFNKLHHSILYFQAIGNFSFNTVTSEDNSQKLAESVIDQFIKVLDNEMHEKTLVHAIQMLTLWCSNLKKSIPKTLILWFIVII